MGTPVTEHERAAGGAASRGVRYSCRRGHAQGGTPRASLEAGGIVFEAVDFGGEARVALSRRLGATSVGVTAPAGGLAPYGRSARLRQHTAALGVSVSFGISR